MREDIRWRLPRQMEGIRAWLKPADYGELHRQAAFELRGQGPLASNSVGVLVTALGREKDMAAAHEEFAALGRIGPAAREAVPELLRWLSRADPTPPPWGGLGIWKNGAANALARIAPESQQVADALVHALALCGVERRRPYLTRAEFNEPDILPNTSQGAPSTRRSLIRALGKLHPQTAETLAALFDELSNGDYAAQATAAEVLGEIRPTTSEIVSNLLNKLVKTEAEHLPDWQDLTALTPPYLDAAHTALFQENPAPEVRMTFREAATIPPEDLDTNYLPGAGFAGWGLRLRVIRSLGRIGPPAQAALALLLQECQAEGKPWRWEAAIAAWRISDNCPETIAAFEHGLHSSELESRRLAAERLGEIAAEFPKALKLLSSALQDSDRQIRWNVLHSLAGLGSNALPVRPSIEALTIDRAFILRVAATQALEAIGPMPSGLASSRAHN